MGGGRRRVTRADLEAMLGEFELVERYGGTPATTVEMHLNQLRRDAMLGGSVGDWARNQGVSLAYARALRRFLAQGG